MTIQGSLVSDFFNDTATTEIYTLSLHDALPISVGGHVSLDREPPAETACAECRPRSELHRAPSLRLRRSPQRRSPRSWLCEASVALSAQGHVSRDLFARGQHARGDRNYAERS